VERDDEEETRSAAGAGAELMSDFSLCNVTLLCCPEKNGARKYGVKRGFSGIEIANDIRLWCRLKTYILGEAGSSVAGGSSG
jgi:hypothetical protein